MENPQLENGYAKIAVEIIDRLQCLYLTPNEWKIFWVVIRKTYGWHKNEDKISISQFSQLTGLSRPNAHRSIKSLVAKSILVAKSSTLGIVYSFNKFYSQWSSSYTATSSKIENTLVAKSSTPVVAKSSTKLVAKSSTTIDSKDNIKNTNTKDSKLYSNICNVIQKDFIEIAEKYKVPLSFVESKYEDMILWHESDPRKNKKVNWRSTLMAWVKKDALQIKKEHYGKSKISYVGEAE